MVVDASGPEQYFEYPSTVAILLREIRYGIEIGFDHVTVGNSREECVKSGSNTTAHMHGHVASDVRHASNVDNLGSTTQAPGGLSASANCGLQ